jgi:hypothetical protein
MTDITFEGIVPHLHTLLTQHHNLYSGRCKSEYWEELCAKALILDGRGSDWEPDFNHGVGVDQTTDDGTRIGNKSGKLGSDVLEISGSRLTKHATLVEKLNFLKNKTEDYILCLATKDRDWKAGKRIYYLIVIDSTQLAYHDATWIDLIGVRGKNTGKVVGHRGEGNGFIAKITKAMSHQLWTQIDKKLFKEMYEIII